MPRDIITESSIVTITMPSAPVSAVRHVRSDLQRVRRDGEVCVCLIVTTIILSIPVGCLAVVLL